MWNGGDKVFFMRRSSGLRRGRALMIYPQDVIVSVYSPRRDFALMETKFRIFDLYASASPIPHDPLIQMHLSPSLLLLATSMRHITVNSPCLALTCLQICLDLLFVVVILLLRW